METSHHESPTMNNFISLICFCLAGIFESLQDLSAELIYTWIFRFLSLASLIMVIIINYPKVKASIYPAKKPKENESKEDKAGEAPKNN